MDNAQLEVNAAAQEFQILKCLRLLREIKALQMGRELLIGELNEARCAPRNSAIAWLHPGRANVKN